MQSKNNNNNNIYTSLQRQISSLASWADDRGPGKKLNNINVVRVERKIIRSCLCTKNINLNPNVNLNRSTKSSLSQFMAFLRVILLSAKCRAPHDETALRPSKTHYHILSPLSTLIYGVNDDDECSAWRQVQMICYL